MSTAQKDSAAQADVVTSSNPPRTRMGTKFRGDAMVAKVKELLHQGTVRRIVVKNDEGHPVLEIPVTAGVVAAVVAPAVTAVGAVAALAYDWTIEVEHRPEEIAASGEVPTKDGEPAEKPGAEHT
ncbi:protein of unknown function [Nakamurella panacisegetis]|uniref:DUF4342 domain-containing protein n=1 Tax=Nakamurella panacisegetis TaxID=1090615 RepID=A0A1H0MQF8_9ACTN|nr:DUF4342 domain-containing protein [Nakamurella panacisegetis]SDO82689.1 protein of unknown function [Nakamurella panacisegetis]